MSGARGSPTLAESRLLMQQFAQRTDLAQRTSSHPQREQRAAEGLTRTRARCGWGCRLSAGSRGARPRDDHKPRVRRCGLRSSGRPLSAAARRAAHPLVPGRNTPVSQPHRCLCGPLPRSAGTEAASAREPCSAFSTGLGARRLRRHRRRRRHEPPRSQASRSSEEPRFQAVRRSSRRGPAGMYDLESSFRSVRAARPPGARAKQIGGIRHARVTEAEHPRVETVSLWQR
jgi:hypothetical protein